MAKTEHISLYNLELEKTMLDLAKSMQTPDNKTLAQQKFSLFYPMIGKDFNQGRELIIYDQFANDWKPTFKLTQKKKEIEEIVKKAFEYSTTSRGCPLDWVNKYWLKQHLYRSFFWNIAYKLVMERYGRTENDWNHIITYSTLFKITPFMEDIPQDVWQAQMFNSAHLFKEELSIMQPKNVLLITNLHNWAEPILRVAGIKYEVNNNPEGYVQATSAYRGSRIIVTRKPFTADHRKFLDEVKRNMI